MKLGRVDVLPRYERVSPDHLAQFGSGAQNDLGAKAKPPLDAAANPLSQPGKIPLPRPKDHVAALHIGFDAPKVQSFKERAELVHFDFIVPADVYGTQQRHDTHHSPLLIGPRTENPNSNRTVSAGSISASLYRQTGASVTMGIRGRYEHGPGWSRMGLRA